MLVLSGFGLLLFLLDQWSKSLAQSGVLALEPSFAGFVQVRCVKNKNRLYAECDFPQGTDRPLAVRCGFGVGTPFLWREVSGINLQ